MGWFCKGLFSIWILFLGGGFDGANSNKILLKLSTLEYCISEEMPDILPFVECLKRFKIVVDACFSSNLSQDLETDMDKLMSSFTVCQEVAEKVDFNLNITWKVHILFAHVVPFCKIRGCGLSRYAEQTGESIHSKFKPTWQRYKRTNVHPEHGDQLLSSIANFSCRRR